VTTAAVTTAADTAALDLDPNAVEFVPLTGDFEPGRFRQIPASAIAPQLQPQDPTHQLLLQEGQQAAHDDLEQQDSSAVADLDRRLSSFALDHISPTTTATTLAMAPASFVQYDEDEDGDVGSTGMDMGVGPVSPLRQQSLPCPVCFAAAALQAHHMHMVLLLQPVSLLPHYRGSIRRWCPS
jgi:hypothetical protein